MNLSAPLFPVRLTAYLILSYIVLGLSTTLILHAFNINAG